MEFAQKKLSARSYDAPAVVYEAALVAHAATTTIAPNCLNSLGDVLDLTKGN
jgi:hypothetical protein